MITYWVKLCGIFRSIVTFLTNRLYFWIANVLWKQTYDVKVIIYISRIISFTCSRPIYEYIVWIWFSLLRFCKKTTNKNKTKMETLQWYVKLYYTWQAVIYTIDRNFGHKNSYMFLQWPCYIEIALWSERKNLLKL